MKMSRSLLAVLTCLAVLMSFSGMAYAATSSTFFNRSVSGYTCTGSGSINGATCRAVFNATANSSSSLEPIVPSAACECMAYVGVLNATGDAIGGEITYGNIFATATYDSPYHFETAGYKFEFNGVNFGMFLIENS